MLIISTASEYLETQSTTTSQFLRSSTFKSRLNMNTVGVLSLLPRLTADTPIYRSSHSGTNPGISARNRQLMLTSSFQDWPGLAVCWYALRELHLVAGRQTLTCSLAGGGAYYFAKQSINADRAARFEEAQRRRQMHYSLEHSGPSPSSSPSHEATSDPAPTRHAPESEDQRVFEKSKYEPTEPYRAKKGDRFS